MIGDKIKTKVLSIRYIPNADSELLKKLKIPPSYASLGIITTDSDDVSYAALDEATKKTAVRVAYAKSMYAGSSNASTQLAGEFIGILAGTNPDEIRSGMLSAVSYIENEAHFYSANESDSIIYFAHCISRTGSYLSKKAGITEGQALAYLIAPPVEAMCGVDAALKTSTVELRKFYGPPTETNFAGALLTGEQAACQAACDAFAEMVMRVAREPVEI